MSHPGAGPSDSPPADAIQVELPGHVVERIDRRLPDTRFDSVDAYAAVALELLLCEVERGPADDREPADGAAVEEADAVRRHLESLGYR